MNKNKEELSILKTKLFKILYLLGIIAVIYVFTLIFNTWKIGDFLISILKILSPLFIGVIIAWLFDPVVNWFQTKKVKRIFGTIIVYVIFISLLALMIGTIVPIMSSELSDLTKSVPGLITKIGDWLSELITKIPNIGIDMTDFETNVLDNLETNIILFVNDLPDKFINIIKVIISGFSNFVIGLVIGFFLLSTSNNTRATILDALPKTIRDDLVGLGKSINTSLRNFIEGTLIDCLLIFVITSLALWAIGMKAPLLFGLFCGLTNFIPYAGPYIGGAPAVIVGFAMSPKIGLLTLLAIAIIQFIEGNFIQAMIMSKTTKLNPVTIISGLLVFGHFFGIIGMFVSTPVLAGVKAIYIYYDSRYHFMERLKN